MKFLKGSSSNGSSSTSSPSKSDSIDFSKELEKTNDLICQIIKWLKENNVVDKYGVFRESGEAKVKDSILKSICFKKSAFIDLSKNSSDDILSVASVMKEVLRNMTSPLLVTDLYNEFIAITKINDYINKILVLKVLFYSLPILNREIVFNIFEFLNVIAANSDNNMMTALNLATVFAPNILFSTGVSQFEMLEHSNLIINIINLLIDEFPFISNKSTTLTQAALDNKLTINNQKAFLTEYQTTHLKNGSIIIKDENEGGVSISSFKSPSIKVIPFYVNEEVKVNSSSNSIINNNNISNNNLIVNTNKKILMNKQSFSAELTFGLQPPQQSNNNNSNSCSNSNNNSPLGGSSPLSPLSPTLVQQNNNNNNKTPPISNLQISSSPTSPVTPLSPSAIGKLNSLTLSPPSSVNKPPNPLNRILPSISSKPPVPSQHTKPTHCRSQSASASTHINSNNSITPIPLHTSQSRTPPPLPSRSQSTSLLNHPPPISISPVNSNSSPSLSNNNISINRTQSNMTLSPSQQRRIVPQQQQNTINHTQSSFSLTTPLSTPPSTPPPLPPSKSQSQQNINNIGRPAPPIPNRSLSSSTIDPTLLSNQSTSSILTPPKPSNRPLPTINQTTPSTTPPASLSSSSENIQSPNNNNPPPNRPPPPTPPTRTTGVQNNSLYQSKNLPPPIWG